MRINGIGTTFLGVSKQDENNIATANVWFTLLYLPIFPFRRMRVRFFEHQGSGFSYQIVSDKKLVLGEILKTYIFGWIIFPVIGLLPLIIAIKEVWQSFGLPQFLHIPYIILTIIWMFVYIWRLADWHEAKCRPKKNKN